MNTFKVKAVRMALINTPLETINEFTEKYGLGDISLQKLADYIIDNGDCGLGVDFTESLMKAFIDMADKHSLKTRDKIEERVNECDFDFLMDDWNYIWDNLFCSAKFCNNVTYVVFYECYEKWGPEKDFTLCSTWDKAQEIFASDKENANISMHERCEEDEIEVEADNKTHYMVETNYYEYWYEVCISKKEIK